MSEHVAAPTQDQLYDLAVTQTREALTAIAGQYQRYYLDPGHWPHLAAALDTLGRRLTAHAVTLAGALAAYADATPYLEVPEHPGVVVLTGQQHHRYWSEAREQACGVEQRADAPSDAQQYGEQVFAEHGRPGLGFRAVALDDHSEGAVMVLLYLAQDGPDAVVLVFIGGKDPADVEQIDTALAEQHIVAGPVRFWAPANAERTFITLDNEQLYDAYGRRVDSI